MSPELRQVSYRAFACVGKSGIPLVTEENYLVVVLFLEYE